MHQRRLQKLCCVHFMHVRTRTIFKVSVLFQYFSVIFHFHEYRLYRTEYLKKNTRISVFSIIILCYDPFSSSPVSGTHPEVHAVRTLSPWIFFTMRIYLFFFFFVEIILKNLMNFNSRLYYLLFFFFFNFVKQTSPNMEFCVCIEARLKTIYCRSRS